MSVLLILSSCNFVLPVSALECSDETPLSNDMPYMIPDFEGLSKVMTIPIGWKVKINENENFRQLIVNRNGASLIATHHKDGSKSSLKKWAKKNRTSFEKRHQITVYSMEKTSVCIGSILMKNYTLTIAGPKGESGDKDLVEMYQLSIDKKQYFINLWAGINQVTEWKQMHDMLVKRDEAKKMGLEY